MKPKRSLISFCNQVDSEENPNLGLLDLESLTLCDIQTGVPSLGFTGLCQNSRYIFAAYQQDPAGIVIFDKDCLKWLYSFHMDSVSDPHSIACDERNNIYVVSTGKDQVIQFHFDEKHPRLKFSKVLFSLSQHQAKDTHHFNSIYLSKSFMLLSAFGPKYGVRWSAADRGYVFDLNRKRILFDGLYHPHSVIVHHNKLYYCESSTGSVFCNDLEIIDDIKGYARGLIVNDRFIVVGISCGRMVSKSTGIFNNPADQGLPTNHCKILIYKKPYWSNRFHLLDEVSLFPKKKEIYDLLLL
jgi:hypothetical protein